MRNPVIIAAALAPLVIAGCATQPESVPALERARAEVSQAESEPLVQQAAGDSLEDAHEALSAAERRLEAGEELEIVEHYAYLASRHAQIAQARANEAQYREELEKAGERRSELLLQAKEGEVQTAQQAALAATAQAESAEMRASELERQRAELERMQAERTSRGYVLTLADVLFATDETQLQPGANQALARLSDFLQDNPERRVVIEGHTDSRGSDEYNQRLSQERAEAVATALQAQGISTDRIAVRGMGEQYPLATNDTSAGRQQNRRVEIIIPDEQDPRSGRGTGS